MIEKVISGGQTGVDRAALDVAMRLGIPVGGWCSQGRWAEDGPISPTYPLQETESSDTTTRTLLNVRDADATLILSADAPSPGTMTAMDEARRIEKPLLLCDPMDSRAPALAVEWFEIQDIRVLNVAGPRESEHPGIYGLAVRFLLRTLGLGRGIQADETGDEYRQE